MIEQSGGVHEIKSRSDFPKNRQQVKYLRRNNQREDDTIKLVENCRNEMKTPEKAFIRSVETSPEKVVFVASQQQLTDLAQFCTDNRKFCILGVDPTHNVGPCYVTHTTYRQLQFITANDEHPVMMGPLNNTYKEGIFILF